MCGFSHGWLKRARMQAFHHFCTECVARLGGGPFLAHVDCVTH
jgi:hypothetical protein